MRGDEERERLFDEYERQRKETRTLEVEKESRAAERIENEDERKKGPQIGGRGRGYLNATFL